MLITHEKSKASKKELFLGLISYTDILFLENGDFFLTEIGDKHLLLWNRNFEFVKYFSPKAKINQHSNIYLTKSTKEEIVVYKLEE